MGRLTSRLAYRRWRAALGLLAVIVLASLLALKSSLQADLPEHPILVGHHPAGITRVLSYDGRLVATLFRENRKPLELEDMGDTVVDALLSVEDHRFRQHSGVDWRAVARAAWSNLWSGQVQEGASTLTMQLARRLYLNQDRTLWRKGQEALLAARMETLYSKDEILAAYLNEMDFGGGAYGVGAASSRLFGKPPSRLSVAEAALLIGLLQSPTYLNPATNPEGAIKRQHQVLARMHELGRLSAPQYRLALAEPMSFRGLAERQTPMLKYPYFTTFAISSLAAEIGEASLYREALTVRTTLDIEAQRLVERVLAEALRNEGPGAGVAQGAIVVIDNETGSLRAMAGGAHWSLHDQFNRAWQARRQAGSSFKPFLYTAALENGYQPFTPVLDAAVPQSAWQNWTPVNSDGRGLGTIPLRQALAMSRNQAAANLMAGLGPHAVTELCARFGFLSDLPEVPSLALGSGAVTPLEMACAYTVFANEGWLVETHPIIDAVSSSGRRLVDHRHPWLSQSTSPEVAAQMTDLLMGVVSQGTGLAASLPGISVAGKTGTTDGYRDAWFVGFTPGYTVAVWMGNDDNSPTRGLYGGALPARLFRRVMAGLPQPRRHFGFLDRQPTELALCARSHAMARQGCRQTYTVATYLPVQEAGYCQQCPALQSVQIVYADTPEAFPGDYDFYQTGR